MVDALTWPALVTALALALVWSSAGLAQEPPKPKDEALDSLLEKIDETKAPADARSKETPPPSEVAPKDKALDSLLEKLGETTETASPDEKPHGPPKQATDEPSPAKPEAPASTELKGKAKDLDLHLEELTGKKPKKKQNKEAEGSGPLADVIKEMRDVETRLGKPDTGEETRKKEEQIVKNLDSIIDQLRTTTSQSQGKKMLRLVMKPGQKQPGNSPGQTPGSTGGNAPQTRPQKPTDKRSLVHGKDEWGHLPPELRQEMDNIFKEEALPTRDDLIRRYYLSVSKKSLAREE